MQNVLPNGTLRGTIKKVLLDGSGVTITFVGVDQQAGLAELVGMLVDTTLSPVIIPSTEE